MQHLVSVIIPVFNGERFLSQAIESVLNQTYTNTEIIVVDDGSTDNTKIVATSFPKITYIYQENQGVACARNNALSIAKGDFITFLDADDCYEPNKLEIQLTYLLNNTATDICFCHQQGFLEEGFELSEKDYVHFMEKEKLGLVSILLRKSVFDKVGLFNVNYRHSSDFEWLTRAIDFACVSIILPDVLVKRRVHDTNITHGWRKNNDNLRFQILKESLERKRKRKVDE